MAEASTSRPKQGRPNLAMCAAPELLRLRRLASDEVAVWWLPTDTVAASDLHRWFGMLNGDERGRADRFHFDEDRRDFIAAHTLLRSILTRFLGLPAPAWRFATDANGKPALDRETGFPEVPFNLSHTRGLVAAAVASRGLIGVDVERIDNTKADLAIAKRYFATSEFAMLQRVPAADRATCFFRLWTLKEAYIKALGTGLNTPLDSFAFTWEPIRINFAAAKSNPMVSWEFAQLLPTDRHVLSLAVGSRPGDGPRIELRGVGPQEI